MLTRNSIFKTGPSLNQVAGIKDIIVIDLPNRRLVHVAIRRGIKSFKKEFDLGAYTVNGVYDLPGNVDGIAACEQQIKSILSEASLQSVWTIVCLEHYLVKNIEVPPDVTDENIWLMEHLRDYLPEGKTAQDYAIQYHRVSATKDTTVYNVMLAKKNEIEEIKAVCDRLSLNVLHVGTENTALLYLHRQYVKPVILIDTRNGSLRLHLVNPDGRYYEITAQTPEQAARSINTMMKEDALKEALVLRQSDSPEATETQNRLLAELQIPTERVVTYRDRRHANGSLLKTVLYVKSVYEPNDRIGDMMDEQRQLDTRSAIEKSAVTRMALTCGVVVIGALLLLMLGEYAAALWGDGRNQHLADLESYVVSVLDSIATVCESAPPPQIIQSIIHSPNHPFRSCRSSSITKSAETSTIPNANGAASGNIASIV